jgi:c-di-GMP-binding flagellar brake protein YcgR
MSDVAPQVNELLQVSFVDGESSVGYASRVEDLDGRKVCIAWPTENGIRVSVRAGEELLLSFTRQDAAYQLRAKVEKTMNQPLPVVVVEPLGSATRTQRRDYVRVAVNIPVEIIGSPSPSSDDETPVVLLIKTRMLDLSGGGFGVHYKDAVQMGTVFEVRFSLPGTSEELHLHAKLVRCERKSDSQGSRIHRLGMAFMDMPESTRSRIVRFVFSVQQSGLRR